MRKLRLDPELLQVETFEMAAASAAAGTVRGLESATEPEEPDTLAATCGCPPGGTAATACGQATCDWSCNCSAAACSGSTCGEYTCVESCYPCVPQG